MTLTMEYPGFKFAVLAEDTKSRARFGRIDTPHGSLHTPAFIFCATKGAIKAASVADLEAANVDVILANTYHMLIQPGPNLVADMGGLHRFTGWNGPMLTDSGGFQIFSLGAGADAQEIKASGNRKQPRLLQKITEEGATFRSPRDGAYHTLTPESSIEIQRKLGADLLVVLDECTPYHVDRKYTENSLALTKRWADRSITEFERGHDGCQALYGVVQGGIYEDLRRESAEFVSSRPFFGHAVGGCLGAQEEQMHDVVRYSIEPLCRDRPVHLLGIGGVQDIWTGVEMGVDTFDCVTPTRIARHGWALSRQGPSFRRNLRNAKFRADEMPLEEDCDCPACLQHSRSYIHHLLKANEILGLQLLTVHNIRYMTRMLATVRSGILTGSLKQAKAHWLRFDN